MSKKICPYLCSLLSMLAVLTIGCGKKAKEESRNKPDHQSNPQLSDLDVELEKQEMYCGADRSCPDYITKIAFNHKGKLKYCTGFLMEQDMVVTSSSCLPENLRMKNADCSKDAFFFFHEQGDKPVRSSCERVIEVSPIEGKEPVLWRSDVAYLKLPTKLIRRTVSFPEKRVGMNDMDKFYSWSVDQIDDHQGIIRKTEDCQAVHNSYFNPLSTQTSSPVMTMSGCEFNEGNSGSPVLDYRGRVRGVVSRPVDNSEIQEVNSMRILERPLRPLFHVSNFACAPVVPQMPVLNEEECNKILNIGSYDNGQRDMINEASLFKSSIQRIEHTANEKNRYLKLAVKLSPSEDGYDVKFEAKCFKDVSKWIGEFSNNKPFTFYIDLPLMRIKKSMNEFGKIYVQEPIRGSELTSFQFRPSILRSSNPRRANVYVWANGPTTTYESVSETCGSLF